MPEQIKLPVISISWIRMGTDGEGVRSLIVSNGCPLRCRYCLNNYCHFYPESRIEYYTVDELYKTISKHKLYYEATNGGITFGGGEPFIHYDFIKEFCDKYGDNLSINIETSLNVKIPEIEKLTEKVNCFIVDIKDMNPDIYKKYTGLDKDALMDNLFKLIPFADKVVLRVPRIPDFNTDKDVNNSVDFLKRIGFTRFNVFNYVVK